MLVTRVSKAHLSESNGFMLSLHSALNTKNASLTNSSSVGNGLPIESRFPSSSIPASPCGSAVILVGSGVSSASDPAT